ncbi:MAG: hypothetical protein FWD74_04855 [Actinomycetia bacterium]|nr:hypothetical protein [Actinomycetes bacterium]
MSHDPIWTEDHWEVAGEIRGASIPTPYQVMNHAERDRIIHQRLHYLEFMHDHFADRIVAPPAGVEEIESTHSHG